jgi:hypothetical protein
MTEDHPGVATVPRSPASSPGTTDHRNDRTHRQRAAPLPCNARIAYQHRYPAATRVCTSKPPEADGTCP